MARDRDATQQRIVEAVGRVLAREGFRGVSLRAVAREAGVDKRLVSRYFGALDKLIAAYAAGNDFWWSVDELVGDDLPGPPENTWASWVAMAVQRHTRALRQRTLTHEILVWELIEANPLADALSLMREERAAELLRRVELKVGQPPGASWRAVIALIGAATTYLVLRARTYGSYVGFDLRAEESWEQFDGVVAAVAQATTFQAGSAAPAREEVSKPAATAAVRRRRR